MIIGGTDFMEDIGLSGKMESAPPGIKIALVTVFSSDGGSRQAGSCA